MRVAAAAVVNRPAGNWNTLQSGHEPNRDFADDDVTGFAVTSPELGTAMAKFSHAVYEKNRLPMRTREAARIVIALANECVTCQNTRDTDGEANGITEEFYDYAAQWRTWPGYSDDERIAMEFAHRFATDHTGLRDDEDFWPAPRSTSTTRCSPTSPSPARCGWGWAGC